MIKDVNLRSDKCGTARSLRNFLVVLILLAGSGLSSPSPLIGAHPQLFFSANELDELRRKRESEVPAAIWKNVSRWADWCVDQPVRTEWIPTVVPDPQYENLYDRFYAAMHDLAIVEHLAFASILSDPQNDPYFEAARAWTLAVADVWQNERDNAPDASKAYAVLRVMKGLAVAYDLLYPRLTDQERAAVRQAIVGVGQAYYEFFQDPVVAGPGYNKHHGSVDAPPLGIMALALLDEVPAAKDWLDSVLQKHIEYLLPHALTPSGTNEQSSNFWASTLHYRTMFFEALRRVTGRDLSKEFPRSLPGRIALAAVAGSQSAALAYNEDNRSVLFGPSYGQINYWSPVLVYLARHHQRPIYQYLAGWDNSLGSLQRTRYVTPNQHEELLFCLGPYAYIWYDTSVKAEIEDNLPLSFQFPEPEVNEAYLRAGFIPGQIVVGMKKGGLIVHAGGQAVLVDELGVEDINAPTAAVEETLIADNGAVGMMRCVGPQAGGLAEQIVELHRPSQLTIDRETSRPLTWWYSGTPKLEGPTLVWPSGTRLTIRRGSISAHKKNGKIDKKVHYAGMEFADPHPFAYPTVTIEPEHGHVNLEITTPLPDDNALQ